MPLSNSYRTTKPSKTSQDQSLADVWASYREQNFLPPHLFAMDFSRIRLYVDRLAAHQVALCTYSPSRIDADVHLFVAAEFDGTSQARPTPALGWDKVLSKKDRFRIIFIPGNHHSIMSTYISELGAALSKAIRKNFHATISQQYEHLPKRH